MAEKISLVKKIIIKLLEISILLLSLATQEACKYPVNDYSEITDLSFSGIIAVDLASDSSNQYTLTIGQRVLHNAGPAQTSKDENFLSEKGKTIFEAARKFSLYSEKQIFWGYTRYVLISDKAAKKGIIPILDFFSRNNQFRFNVRIYIVHGSKASDILTSCKPKNLYISEILEGLAKENKSLSYSGNLKLVDLINRLYSPTGSYTIPSIKIKNKIKRPPDEPPASNVSLDGYAVFKNNTLHSFITGSYAIGYNILLNNYHSGITTLQDEKGNPITIDIVDSDLKIIPHNFSGNLSFTIDFTTHSNISESQSEEKIKDNKFIDELSLEHENILKNYISEIIKKSQNENNDFLFLWNTVYHKKPMLWKSLQNQWISIYPSIPFDIKVHSFIIRSYVIEDPNVPEKNNIIIE